MAETKEKLIWIDVAKVIGALSVAYGHTGGMLGALLMSFMMPFFFATSGYLAGLRYGKRIHGAPPLPLLDLERCLRLSVATIFWATAFVIIVRWNEIASLAATFDPARFISLALACLTLPSYPDNGPLWFLRDLAVLSLIAPVLYRLETRRAVPLGLILVALPTAPYLKWGGNLALPIYVTEFFNGLLFFSVGLWASKSATFMSLVKQGVPPFQTTILATGATLIFTWHWLYGGGYGLGMAILGLATFCAVTSTACRAAPAMAGFIAKGAKVAFLCYVSHYILIVKLELAGHGIKNHGELASLLAALGLFGAAYLIRLPFLLLGPKVSSMLLLHPVRARS